MSGKSKTGGGNSPKAWLDALVQTDDFSDDPAFSEQTITPELIEDWMERNPGGDAKELYERIEYLKLQKRVTQLELKQGSDVKRWRALRNLIFWSQGGVALLGVIAGLVWKFYTDNKAAIQKKMMDGVCERVEKCKKRSALGSLGDVDARGKKGERKDANALKKSGKRGGGLK